MPAIDGLSSGLDTGNIIRQLMQLERVPQARLQNRQSATESSILSLRTLNSKFLAISSIAEKLGAALPGAAVTTTTAPTDWTLTTATSSDATRASAQAVTGAPAGSLTFNVKQLATAESRMGTTTYAGTDAVFAAAADGTTMTSLSLTKGGATPTTTVIATGDGSLAATIKGINDAGVGVTATAVQVQPGQYRLQLTSTTTGAGAISLAGSDGSAIVLDAVVAGQDAVIALGTGLEITRSSNTLSDVLQGVTLTLSKADTRTRNADGSLVEPPTFAEPAVTIAVSKDTEGIAAKVQALVDAANAARSEAKSLTAFDPVTKVKGRLYGDSTVRGLIDQVRQAITGGTDGPSLAGVEVTRDGTVTFDKTKFLSALNKDPAAVEAALGKDGLAGRLQSLADTASRKDGAVGGAGLLTNAISGRESQVARFKTEILSWDSRLALKEKTLQRQYTALETALGKARSQGQWLSGQLASLPQGG